MSRAALVMPPDLINSWLPGIWAFRRRPDDTEEMYFQVFADGRMVQFYKQHARAARPIGSTMRASAEGADQYRIKIAADAPGYLVSFQQDGENLVIVNRGERFVCRRISAAEVPAWLPELVAKAVWK